MIEVSGVTHDAAGIEDAAPPMDEVAALRDVLDVISLSRDDDQPVFEKISQAVARLCDASLAYVSVLNAARTHITIPAVSGARPEFAERLARFSVPVEDDWIMAVDSALNRRVISIEDLSQDPLYKAGNEYRVSMVDEEGMRSVLVVPLVKGTQGMGCIFLYRREVRPFTEAEVAIVRSFAAQAVIAIENARQFREVQTRLAREKASAEVLAVISRSRDDEGPVFEAILENACALCNAPLAGLILGTAQDEFQTLAAHKGMLPEAVDLFETLQMRMDGNLSYAARSIIESRLLAFDDMGESDLYKSGSPVVQSMVDVSGIHSVLFVPLIRDGAAIGNITLFRREISPFDESEISLVETFAAQAVVAIENVRQFREVQTRLERERASAEVLEVISVSRDDESPVFDSILSNAAKLCHAPIAWLLLVDESQTELSLAAYHGSPRRALDIGQTWRLDEMDQQSGLAMAIAEGKTLQDEDLSVSPGYLAGQAGLRQLVDEEGMRTRVTVPLHGDGRCLGALVLSRREVTPFGDDEIRLVDTFARQAVIAIENVRQFREVRTRLEREAATKDILQVISSSRSDHKEVFATLLERAVSLLDSEHGSVWLVSEDGTHIAAVARHEGGAEIGADFDQRDMTKTDSVVAGVVRSCSVWKADDFAALPEFADPAHPNRIWIEQSKARSMLLVPLVLNGQGIGLIAVYRRRVLPYSSDHVALLEGFAAQAVIAIENVRQFNALETLNTELGARVKEQVGEIERMGKLKRFLPAAVADTVVREGSEKMLKSHRALLGVLFCDIRGFTAFCETAEPEETIEVLQTYHEEMGKLINDHGAGVDHRMGDGIMVLFNDPLPCDDPAGDAVRLALAMQARMADLCKGWKRLGHRLGFGVGISLGYATVGMVGYEGRSDYTASGTAVNLAARLCDQAEDGEILLSTRAAIAVEDDYASESRGAMDLKGIREPVEVFALLT